MTVSNTAQAKIQRMIGFGTLMLSDANTTPTSIAGILNRDPGTVITPTEEEAELFGTHASAPLNIDRTTDRVEITATLIQFASTTLGIYHGRDEVGQFVSTGGAPEIRKQFAARVNATRADGVLVRFNLPDCVIQPNGEVAITPTGHSMLPILIKGQYSETDSRMSQWQIGAGNDEQTLATNILTRVVGVPASRQYHQVVGEGDAADIVDTIVADGTPLADGEVLTLQRKAGVSYAITITNNATGSDTVDLEGTDDVVLANDADTLVLVYDGPGTEWKERERFITGLA